LEQLIVGLIFGIVSLFLPWSIASIYSGEDDWLLDRLTMNALDFVVASEPSVLFCAFLFLIGMLLFTLNRWFVIAQLIGMIGLSLTMFSYAGSTLTSNVGPLMASEYLTTDFGLGYLLGWISILILGTLLIGEKRRKSYARKHERLPPPSETEEMQLSGWSRWWGM
jgi:hypothetical protein